MLKDCVLPAELEVSLPPVRKPRVIFVTGATGFVGRQLLRQLLAIDELVLFCLVRADSEADAESRLDDCLAAVHLSRASFKNRLHVARGDVTERRFGLSAERYDEIALQVEAVYHCAAEVNWARSYRKLRHTNVGGTLEALRFAFHRRAKAFTYISTISVCYTPDEPAVITERTNMLPWMHAMPLGYSQSKCVSEELLRAAAARGLPVTVVRTAILSGDSATGTAAPNDLIPALFESCVKQGTAPDFDWFFECVPVDYAARALVALGGANQGSFEVYHLRARQPRHWREIVLWLNLLGYHVRLEPAEDWIHRMFGHRGDHAGRLFPFRRFFKGLPGTRQGLRPFEICIAGQSRVSCTATEARLAELGIREPLLDADYFDRCVGHFVSTGVLPRLPCRKPLTRRKTDDRHRVGIEAYLRCQHGDPSLRIEGWEPVPFDSSSGLMNEIASVRLGADIGIRRFRIAYTTADASSDGELDILVKSKAEDAVTQGLLTEVASLCDPELGRQFGRFARVFGFERSHLREPAIYRTPDRRFTRHLPRCYDIVCNDGEHVWSLAIEYLSNVELLDSSATAEHWTTVHIEEAIRGAAAMHSVWYGRERELRSEPWIASEIGPHEARAMRPLWHALINFADESFADWAGHSLRPILGHIVEGIEYWWGELAAMPCTLIHNDFNPRNLAFRRVGERPVVCAFDWELARIGIPQHDLAELLCFVLPEEADFDQVASWMTLQRRELAANCDQTIDPTLWVRGFLLALQRIAIERLPLYTIAHRFKPQPFLPHVIANWARLYEFGQELAANPQRTAA
ncbi:MAG: thioester reductase domain-containing protein [Gemmatimonadota bacterium]